MLQHTRERRLGNRGRLGSRSNRNIPSFTSRLRLFLLHIRLSGGRNPPEFRIVLPSLLDQVFRSFAGVFGGAAGDHASLLDGDGGRGDPNLPLRTYPFLFLRIEFIAGRRRRRDEPGLGWGDGFCWGGRFAHDTYHEIAPSGSFRVGGLGIRDAIRMGLLTPSLLVRGSLALVSRICVGNENLLFLV